MSWDDNKIANLKQLWDSGVPTSQIGQQLGFSKNAIIGKAFRLGLERRQNSRKSNISKRPASSFSSPFTVNEQIQQVGSAVPVQKKRQEKFQLKKTIVGSSNFKSCQWPIGDPLEDGFHYCGERNIPTKPYCMSHYKVAYNVDDKYLNKIEDFIEEK